MRAARLAAATPYSTAMTRTTTRKRGRPEDAQPDPADWRLARHDFHLATPRGARNEPRPYPIAVPRGGPDPTDPAAAPFLPLVSPPPASTHRLSTDMALQTFGFRRLHQAVLACLRRERERARLTEEQHRTAEAADARIERLAASLTKSAADGIEVSFDSPRGMLAAAPGGAAARIRLRIGGNGRHAGGEAPLPLTLDVDPADPLVNPKVAAGGVRIDVAPPGLGRLARIAATDRAGFRPPAPTPRMVLAAARACAAGWAIRVRTRTVDDTVEPRVETCTPDAVARLLLACCWPRLTPEDPKSAWVLHLRKQSAGPDAQRTTLARCDRASGCIVMDEHRLDDGDGEAVTGLVAALRAAGRAPGERYWTHHRTPYPAEQTAP